MERDSEKPSRIEPPPSLDPAIARFIEELARAAVRRQQRQLPVKSS
jgi:hypothetical protein